MQGSPVARISAASGRFVYTLYQNPGGYPFVHALDAVRGTAHCVGLPWSGDQSVIGTMKLTLRDHGRVLGLDVPWNGSTPPSTLPSYTIDTRTYAVSEPQPLAPRGFPWWRLGFLAVPLLATVALLLRGRRLMAWSRGKHGLAGLH